MNRGLALATTVVVLGVAAVVAFAVANPLGGLTADRTSETAVGTTETPASAGQARTTGTPSGEDPFALRVTEVTNCGLTCREVTVTLTNEAEHPVRDVAVRSELLAGDQLLVERSLQVGRLYTGETVSRTVRLTVGFSEISAIQANGGYVTVETTVSSAAYEETFTTRRKVL